MNETIPEFTPFQKIARYSRSAVVTEKIDGTNASVHLTEGGLFLTGSRNGWVTPEKDNYGFSRWAHDNKDQLMNLGVGSHFGEWWGKGIQRGYGVPEKRFSLFNVKRWVLAGQEPKQIPQQDPRIIKMQGVLPACVGLVPVLGEGMFGEDGWINTLLFELKAGGSKAAPGFMNPEGIIIFHTQGNLYFKKTIKNDEQHKGT